jgi:hypothetical protein
MLASTRRLLDAWLRDLPAAWIVSNEGGQYADEIGPWRQYLRIISGVPG